MRHITEEEWIEYYYGESTHRQFVQEHLAECAECAATGRELARDLAELSINKEVPARTDSYGENVWETLKPSLRPHAQEKLASRVWRWPRQWSPRLTAGIACAALTLAAITVVAFYSGRWWEHRQQPQVAATGNEKSSQRVILYVVGDHLDRSQRLLNELNNPDQAAADHRLQSTARELLTENRLYRQSSEHVGNGSAADSSLDTVLDDLEPVLVELANQPEDLNRAAIIRLQKELHTSGLLFEIRVLRSKVQTEEPDAVTAQANGTV